MTNKIIVFLLLSVLSLSAKAQTDGNYDYTKEFIWGISKNTVGGMIGGFVMKFSSAIGEKQFRTIGFELMNVKNPKEVRRNSQEGNPFIYGKSNYLYAIRAQYGRDFILFRKAQQQGVQISLSVAAGPTIGIVAPYYVQRRVGGNQSNNVQFGFDPKTPGLLMTDESIMGTGKLFEGLWESSIKPGINLKSSMSFEMGAFKSNVTGIELGAMIEAYAGKVELMPLEPQKSVYVSAFITLFYGSRR